MRDERSPDHPPGTILVVSGDLTRYAAFSQSLVTLQMPDGTGIVWVNGMDVVANLNIGLANRAGAWVWIMADDHVFGADILMRLLTHQVDVISPLCYQRKPPYRPLVYRHAGPDIGDIERVPMEELPSSGVHPVAACSGAGLLIRSHVLDRLTPPYFEQGKREAGEMTEDLWFMQKLRQAGFSICVDFETVLGHQTPAVIWPIRDANGCWKAAIDVDCGIPVSSAAPCVPGA